MKVRNAIDEPVVFSKHTIIYFILWIPASFIMLAGLKSELLAVFLIFLGVFPLFYFYKKDHDRAGKILFNYKELLQSAFACPECDCKIEESVAYEEKYDVPILFHCKKCDILWYTGMHTNKPM